MWRAARAWTSNRSLLTKHVAATPATFPVNRYQQFDAELGTTETRESLLLASGWWGAARHMQYTFELMAAWSWGLLANVQTHGALPLLYPSFLTILLIHRAARDEEKCAAKYGKYWAQYTQLVPYSIMPFIY